MDQYSWIGQRYTYEDWPDERQIYVHTVKTPPKPPKKEVINYGLPKSKQKFYPPDQNMVWTIDSKLKDVNPDGTLKTPLTSEEIDFIDQQWYFREHGMWFFNNGYLEYITPEHWFYLSYFKIATIRKKKLPTGEEIAEWDFNLPVFIDADRDHFLLWDEAVRRTNCVGLLEITNRRSGKSFRALSKCYNHATQNHKSNVAIQSKNFDDAKDLTMRLVESWTEMPAYFKPLDAGFTNPQSGISFRAPSKFSGGTQHKTTKALNSWIKPFSSNKTKLDGKGIARVYQDEIGKCFSINTLIRMHDGSVKKVQDVKEGDIVMGPNGSPRRAYGITSGREQMYKVVPNKGEPWGCNESHILTMKWCSSQKRGEWNKEDTVNMSVREYLNLPASAQKHLVLYREGVDYSEKKTDIHPYLLGLWLGDGSINGVKIWNPDNEVGDWLKENYDDVTEKREPGCYKWSVKGQSAFFRKYDLLQNKHIPIDFQFNSEQNRLQLLAGLLDSDGHLTCQNGNASNYEITQKKADLAYEIKDLANGLGFYSTVTEKEATMKRKDGSVYRCPVYRINIYGDLYRIPCKVERKIARKFDYHKNRRNPMRTGFKVVPDGVGDYYGFAVDQDHLFLLADYTVVHNTVEVDIYKRWYITKPTLAVGSYVIGKAMLTSTVEEMEGGGGAECKKLWDDSDLSTVNETTGMTESGLINYFKPAYYGFMGESKDKVQFIDDYGYSNWEAAKEYQLGERKGLSGEKLWDLCRKFPHTIEEAFRSVASDSIFILERVFDQIDHNLTLPKGHIRQGNIVGNLDDGFKFVDSEKGPFKIASLPDIKDQNARIQRGNKLVPANDEKGVFGCDPYDHSGTSDSRFSKGALHGIDHIDPFHKLRSGGVFLEYIYRQPTVGLFVNDMIGAAVLYGRKILIENQKQVLINQMENMGLQKYMVYTDDRDYTKTQTNRVKPGISTAGKIVRERMMSELATYISQFVGQISEETQKDFYGLSPEEYMSGLYGRFPFNETLQQLVDFNPADWEKFDGVVSLMLAVLELNRRTRKFEKAAEVSTGALEQLKQLFRGFDISGSQSALR